MVRWVAGGMVVGMWCLLVSLAAAEGREEVVEISTQGFASTSIQINVGDTIIWKNTDSVPHWPASNLHPSHALYSEFDPKQPIQPGEEWRFTFLRSGEWRFHDHVYPARGGVISVHGTSTARAEDVPRASRTAVLLAYMHRIMPGWWLNRLSFETITAMVTHITERDSPEAALIFIHDRLDGVSDVTGAAVHGLKHIVGQALYERDGLDGLLVCTLNPDSAVDGACYHGVMEAFFLDASIGGALDQARFESLCTPWITRNDCLNIFHGIGHGYASYVGLNLEEALTLCAQLPRAFQVRACMTGVHMEWSESVPFARIAERKSDPWSLCSEMDTMLIRATCAFEMPRLVSFMHEGWQNIDFDMFADGDAIGKGCMGAPDALQRALCYQGAGFMASIRITREHSVADICEHLPGEKSDIKLCLIAGAQRLELMQQSEYVEDREAVCTLLRDTYAWDSCFQMPDEVPSGNLLGARES